MPVSPQTGWKRLLQAGQWQELSGPQVEWGVEEQARAEQGWEVQGPKYSSSSSLESVRQTVLYSSHSLS